MHLDPHTAVIGIALCAGAFTFTALYLFNTLFND